MRDYFYQLADEISARLEADEVFTCHLAGEDSDFVRLNHNRVRQAGHVRQIELEVDLIRGERHASAQLDVSGDLKRDLALLEERLQALRAQRTHLEDDPHLLYATEAQRAEDLRGSRLAPARDALADIVAAAQGLDLVGYLASGPQYQGFASAIGGRYWFESASFNLDCSCHLGGDQAIKTSYAGFAWKPADLRRRMEEIRAQLEILKRPVKTLTPGRYRAYLGPAALHEVLDTVCYGGFSLKAQRTMQSPLLKLARQERRLAPTIDVTENHQAGLAPLFTPSGFIKPGQVSLIRQGRLVGCLAAPRSAKEYGVAVNAALERPQSLELAGGELAAAEVLQALGDGLYINNLWYCNFSDRIECRLTGLTRYACFLVEHGEIVAPINVMRFDDSIYRMFGDNLIALTREREFRFDAETYVRRSTASMRLPGALIDGFNLTL